MLIKETKTALRNASDGIMDDFLINAIRLSAKKSKNAGKDTSA